MGCIPPQLSEILKMRISFYIEFKCLEKFIKCFGWKIKFSNGITKSKKDRILLPAIDYRQSTIDNFIQLTAPIGKKLEPFFYWTGGNIGEIICRPHESIERKKMLPDFF